MGSCVGCFVGAVFLNPTNESVSGDIGQFVDQQLYGALNPAARGYWVQSGLLSDGKPQSLFLQSDLRPQCYSTR